jgi:hypothetical protein
VFPVVDNPASATATNKITYGNLVTNMSSSLAPGLVLIKTQTVGSGVSSVTVTDAFSALYDNYKIVLTGIDGTNVDVFLNMTINGATGSNYRYVHNRFSFIAVGVVLEGDGGISTGVPICTVGISDEIYSETFVGSPFRTAITQFNYKGGRNNSRLDGFGTELTQASSTAFTLTPAAGTITGGTIRVYGYRN